MWLISGFNNFDGLFGTFPYFVKIIFFTTWLEHVVTHCWAKSLKTVLKLMIFWNIIGLSMLRIIAVAVLAILVEFRLDVVLLEYSLIHCHNVYLIYAKGGSNWDYFWAKKLDKLCVFPEVCYADTVEKTHGRISGGHSRDFAQYCKFIQPSSMPVFCVILTTLIVLPYIHGNRTRSSLRLQMAWPLAVPGHRHAQWRVQSYTCMFKLLLSTFS